MSNPTSNFGWQMPTSTDLVTDLPADFEVFGQAVDTDFVDLLGGTTGQILSKTSATDLDFTWVSPNAGDITGVTAGTGISGGGTSGTVTVTNDMATTITAAGDIVIGTGSGTYDNLPIGTTNQVLTADTTVSPYKVKWATPAAGGGMTLLDTMTLSGASTTSASFSSAYNQLFVYVQGAYIASGNEYYGIRFNADSGSNYSYGSSALFNSTGGIYGSAFNTTAIRVASLSTTNADDNAQRATLTITRPKDTNNVFLEMNSWMRLTGSNQNQWWGGVGCYNNSAALTSMTFVAEGSTFSGGTVYIYGVN